MFFFEKCKILDSKKFSNRAWLLTLKIGIPVCPNLDMASWPEHESPYVNPTAASWMSVYGMPASAKALLRLTDILDQN